MENLLKMRKKAERITTDATFTRPIYPLRWCSGSTEPWPNGERAGAPLLTRQGTIMSAT